MIVVTNLKYYSDLDFDEYLAIKGYSFSGLKMLESGKAITPSEGMKLGTRVHNFLLEPHKYDQVDYSIVTKIGGELKKFLGPAIKFLEKEVAFTCTMEYGGMELTYKGRADLLYKGKLIIDLKVLSGRLKQATERFGYQRQLSGYAIATGINNILLLSYNKSLRVDNIEHQMFSPNQDWWMYVITKYGTPSNNN
jgi:hypothetical protein